VPLQARAQEIRADPSRLGGDAHRTRVEGREHGQRTRERLRSLHQDGIAGVHEGGGHTSYKGLLGAVG
jgi:hypothetical protein